MVKFVIVFAYILTLSVADDTGTCHYEFHVPRSQGAACMTKSKDMELNLRRMESQMAISQIRTTSMADFFKAEIERLGNENKAHKQKLDSMMEDLSQLRASVEVLTSLNEDLDALKKSFYDGKQSFGEKFHDLQKQVLDTVLKLQTELAERAKVFNTIQNQLTSHSAVLMNHSHKLSAMDNFRMSIHIVSQNVDKLKDDSDHKTQAIQGLKDRVSKLEESLKTTQSDSADMEHMKATLNTLQTGIGPGRLDFENLHNTMRTIQKELGVLRQYMHSRMGGN